MAAAPGWEQAPHQLPAASGLLIQLLVLRLDAGGSVRLTITSASMAPLLRPGDAVLVTPVAVSTLRVGDIVVQAAALAPASRLLAHRLVAVHQGRSGEVLLLVTKGDAAAGYDRPLPARPTGNHAGHAVLGRVAAVRRGGRVLALTPPHARATARLLAQFSRFGAGAARLRPPLLRRSVRGLLTGAMTVAAKLAWRASLPADA